MEVAYASFCGFGNIIIPGPQISRDAGHADTLTQYARAIHEVLSVGIYVSISILLPFVAHPDMDVEGDIGSLASFAREDYVNESQGQDARKGDLFGAWEAWHVIRTVCSYSQRLYVGKISKEPNSQPQGFKCAVSCFCLDPLYILIREEAP